MKRQSSSMDFYLLPPSSPIDSSLPGRHLMKPCSSLSFCFLSLHFFTCPSCFLPFPWLRYFQLLHGSCVCDIVCVCMMSPQKVHWMHIMKKKLWKVKFWGLEHLLFQLFCEVPVGVVSVSASYVRNECVIYTRVNTPLVAGLGTTTKWETSLLVLALIISSNSNSLS